MEIFIFLNSSFNPVYKEKKENVTVYRDSIILKDATHVGL